MMDTHIVPGDVARYKVVPLVEPPRRIYEKFPTDFVDEFSARNAAFTLSRVYGRRVAIVDKRERSYQVYEHRDNACPDPVNQTIPYFARADVFGLLGH